jgi:hypothetical protein
VPTDYKSDNEEIEESEKPESPIPDLPWPQFEAPIEPILDFSPIPAETCQPVDLSPYNKQVYHHPQEPEAENNWLNRNSAPDYAHQTREEFVQNFRRLKNLQEVYYSRFDQNHQEHNQQLQHNQQQHNQQQLNQQQHLHNHHHQQQQQQQQNWPNPQSLIPASTSFFPPSNCNGVEPPSSATKRFQPDQGTHHINPKNFKSSHESESNEVFKTEIIKTEIPPSPYQSDPPPLTPWPPVPDVATSPPVVNHEAVSPETVSPPFATGQAQHRNFWLHAKEEDEDSDDGLTAQVIITLHFIFIRAVVLNLYQFAIHKTE